MTYVSRQSVVVLKDASDDHLALLHGGRAPRLCADLDLEGFQRRVEGKTRPDKGPPRDEVQQSSVLSPDRQSCALPPDRQSGALPPDRQSGALPPDRQSGVLLPDRLSA